MSKIKVNFVANLIGKAWAAFAALVFIPVYIKLMGIEGYGLVGFAMALQAIFSLLDMGLGTAMNREAARLSAVDDYERIRNLVRTLEFVYWPIAILVCLAVVALVPYLSHEWIKAGSLTTGEIETAIMLMAAMIAFRIPFSMYNSALLGLQHHVAVNGITVLIATVRNVGAVLILWLVAPTVKAFFVWQVLMEVGQTSLAVAFLWRSLRRGDGARSIAHFDKNQLKDIWRFTAGMAGISALGVLLAQMDKLLISKMLPLEMLGYYMLAYSVAGAILFIAYPLSTTLFPKFSELIAKEDTEALRAIYYKGCTVMSIIVWPVAIILAMFSYEILLLWTTDQVMSKQAAPALSVFALGAAVNAMVLLPYSLQLASGWVRLALYTNAVLIVVLGVLAYLLIEKIGMVGGAVAWLLVNVVYFLVYIPAVHRRFFPSERGWYMRNIGQPLGGTLVICGFAYLCYPSDGLWLKALYIMVSLLAAFVVAVVVTQLGRQILRGYVQQFMLNARQRL